MCKEEALDKFSTFEPIGAILAMVSTVKNFGISSYFNLNLTKPLYSSRYSVAQCSATKDSAAASLSSKVNGTVNGLSSVVKDVSNWVAETVVEIETKDKVVKLEVLWDDGYGNETVKDYLDYAQDIIRPDGGPPRWFTPVSCGPHLKDSPVLLFLPGNNLILCLFKIGCSLLLCLSCWCSV